MITNTVGHRGRNGVNDTMIIQRLLNRVRIPGTQQLVADGSLGVRTIFKPRPSSAALVLSGQMV